MRSVRETIATPKTDAKINPGLNHGLSVVLHTASVNHTDWTLKKCIVSVVIQEEYEMNVSASGLAMEHPVPRIDTNIRGTY
jgi:hypothetical protein